MSICPPSFECPKHPMNVPDPSIFISLPSRRLCMSPVHRPHCPNRPRLHRTTRHPSYQESRRTGSFVFCTVRLYAQPTIPHSYPSPLHSQAFDTRVIPVPPLPPPPPPPLAGMSLSPFVDISAGLRARRKTTLTDEEIANGEKRLGGVGVGHAG